MLPGKDRGERGRLRRGKGGGQHPGSEALEAPADRGTDSFRKIAPPPRPADEDEGDGRGPDRRDGDDPAPGLDALGAPDGVLRDRVGDDLDGGDPPTGRGDGVGA